LSAATSGGRTASQARSKASDSVFLVFPSVAADAAAPALITTTAGLVRPIVDLSAHGVPDEPDPHAVPDGSILAAVAARALLLPGAAVPT